MSRIRFVSIAALIQTLFVLTCTAKDAAAQFSSNSQSASFTGAWCAQGDPTKHASIADNGAFLTLTNENGDTSTGQYQGQTGIVAQGWQFVSGTLSPDASQINCQTVRSGHAVVQEEVQGIIGQILTAHGMHRGTALEPVPSASMVRTCS